MSEATWNQLIEEAKERVGTNPKRIRVDTLLDHWGAKRRGYRIVQQIDSELAGHGLVTEPHLTKAWIRGFVKLVAVTDNRVEPLPDLADTEAAAEVPPVGLTFDSLESANAGVIPVNPQESLAKAQSLMMAHDFSQLPVMISQRALEGAVSWESIAHARMVNPQAELRDATVPAVTVSAEDDLLTHIHKIIEAGYVFVRAKDKTIQGIVTTSDLSQQFADQASPFLYLSEIERRLRAAISSSFSVQELKDGVADGDPERKEHLTSADAMTLGEYQRLLENPERWERFAVSVDRGVFIAKLEEVRDIRNEVMHFSPDPLEDEQLRILSTFLRWLRRLNIGG